ncbi:hypothetical protein K493DRAFT_381145 [Basidiobolus meristosporus CBS 931.73]|uniref:C4-dicarboxylate transporter/malic acid transport protein n=1 Tax=Basidiobolus meristosporus CBS 931.73 TaxID=1314790 RepID=A0A1Y1XWT7_9FUNG|nr:hypothetical protein K493DRAFT_381145 [Basidiobolus meristosporus CBS 931.73]|eukprot:ORX90198.1 hypothetical protein K493DRAFT_381145 [Basidiobolus meristosporus CBS 931.73]
MKPPFHELPHPREVIRHFTPSWFAVNMGTGITGILIANFPFPFRGMVIIGTIFYLANVCMFSLFSIVFIVRLFMFPEVIPAMLRHHQSLMLSTIPMGLTTITNYTVLVLVPSHSWAIELAYVLWWIEFSLTILSILGIPFCMMIYQEHSIDIMNGSWLLPLVPAVVTGASGCYLSRFLEAEGHRAIMILTISAITLGCGLSLAFPVIGIYFYRLVAYNVPGEDVIITTFLPVGPLGQGTYGIIELGRACQKIIGDTYAPGFGDSAFTVCIIIAFFLWGYGLWYLCFAVISLSVRSKSHVPFNMGWWGLTFPLGVYTAGTLNIAVATHSRFFRGLAHFSSVSWFWYGCMSPQEPYVEPTRGESLMHLVFMNIVFMVRFLITKCENVIVPPAKMHNVCKYPGIHVNGCRFVTSYIHVA